MDAGTNPIDAGSADANGSIVGGAAGFIDPKLAERNSGDIGRAGDGDSGSGNTSAPYGLRADGTPARKRGRKPGSGNGGSSKRSNEKAGNSPVGLEKLLYSIHSMAAGFFKAPELMIDNAEAQMLSAAIAEVQNFYDFDASEEVIIWTNLVGAIIAVYGPRAFVMLNKPREKKVDQPKQVQKPVNAPVDDSLDRILNPHKYR